MGSFDSVQRSSRLDLVGRRVFLRADLEMPLSEQGAVLDDTRLRELLPTLRSLRAEKAKVILAGSFGTVLHPAPEGAQRGITDRLTELLGMPVGVLSRQFAAEIPWLTEGSVALFPDLGRIPQEASDDAQWALELARAIDVYVNDGIRASMVRTASVDALPRQMASRGAGPRLASELENYRNYVEAVSAPFTAVVGGGSVTAREELLRFVVERADALLLGGVVANTFLSAAGVDLGMSAVDRPAIPVALDLMDRARARGVDLRVPVDAMVATRATPDAAPVHSVRRINQIGPTDAIVDVAVETCVAYRTVLVRSATVLFNGLMGLCADGESQSGTIRVAQAATEAARYTLLIGDGTVAAARRLRLESLFRDVASGGDASLALLRGVPAPGIESLRVGLANP